MNELKTAHVSADGGVNLRVKPSTSSARVLTIPKGGELSAAECNETWSKVLYNGQEGYVMTQYISFGEASLDDNADALKLIENMEKELSALKRMLQA